MVYRILINNLTTTTCHLIKIQYKTIALYLLLPSKRFEHLETKCSRKKSSRVTMTKSRGKILKKSGRKTRKGGKKWRLSRVLALPLQCITFMSSSLTSFLAGVRKQGRKKGTEGLQELETLRYNQFASNSRGASGGPRRRASTRMTEKEKRV